MPQNKHVTPVADEALMPSWLIVLGSMTTPDFQICLFVYQLDEAKLGIDGTRISMVLREIQPCRGRLFSGRVVAELANHPDSAGYTYHRRGHPSNLPDVDSSSASAGYFKSKTVW